MSTSVTLTPSFQSHYHIGEHVGFRLRVDASAPNGISDAYVFRYFRKPTNSLGVADSVFSGVCSWPDYVELPKTEPDADTSPAGFRLDYIDLVVSSETVANETWELIKVQVQQLMQTIKDGNTLAAATPYVASAV